MEIYLIRHTTPAVAKNICYGQTDLDLTDSLQEEAAIICQHLPGNIGTVHSSPLQRCVRLAKHLFPAHSIYLHNELMEIHCGRWEMKSWDEVPAEEIDLWMKDFVQERIPGGESYLDLNARVIRCFNKIRDEAARALDFSTIPTAANGALAIITHGGPIRSILSLISGTALNDSFKIFALHYGCVVRISEREGIWQYELLSNRAPQQKEQQRN